MYMNQIYFGQGAYGIQTAAKTYFNKDVNELSLTQCAMLAGLPKSPNYYSPFNNLNEAKKRKNVVLDQMVKYGYVSAAEAEDAKNQDLGLSKTTRRKKPTNTLPSSTTSPSRSPRNTVTMPSIKKASRSTRPWTSTNNTPPSGPCATCPTTIPTKTA